MAKTSNQAVKARQAAMAALLKQEEARLERTAAAVVEVKIAHEEMTRLEMLLAEQRATFAGSVNAALGLGKSAEELAALAGVPVGAVRAARRGGVKKDGEEPASAPTPLRTAGAEPGEGRVEGVA